jgi:glycosyltransferase involved in cell wall biosynthesis
MIFELGKYIYNKAKTTTQKSILLMISIIIPNYNRADLIGFTLDSLLNQTFENWECIIVDDGSTDESEACVKKYLNKDSRFSFYNRPQSFAKGANSCRNFGLSKAEGQYIKWVDSDDLLTPNCLQLQFELIDNQPNAQVCLAYGRFFNDTTGIIEEEWSKNLASKNYLYDHIINQIMWPIGAILWRKSNLDTKPFSETLKNSQEWLMHSLALVRLKDEQIINLTETVYLIRRGNLRMSSNTSSKYYINQAKARVLLLLNIISKGIFSMKILYQLTKQTIIYLFHAAKQTITK